MMQIISKAHKAEERNLCFCGEAKGITPQEAENVDLAQFIKELVSDSECVVIFFQICGHLKGPRIAELLSKNIQSTADYGLLPLSAIVDYLLYAIEQKRKEQAWEFWTNISVLFMEWLNPIKFEKFKEELFQKQYRYTQKSLRK